MAIQCWLKHMAYQLYSIGIMKRCIKENGLVHVHPSSDVQPTTGVPLNAQWAGNAAMSKTISINLIINFQGDEQ
jgi:hypothetical protein